MKMHSIKEEILEQIRTAYYDYYYAASRIETAKRASEADLRYLNYCEGVCAGTSIAARTIGITEDEIRKVEQSAKELARDEYAREEEEELEENDKE